MKDLWESLRAQIYHRMSSPLFGTFVIAWLCWNHRYLFILFSDVPVENRFMLAQLLLYPDVFWIVGRNLVFPFLSTLAFILIYPHPSKWLFSYWHKRQIEVKKLRDEIEGETLLTKEESRKVILDSISQNEKYEQLIEKQAREIDALKSPGGALVTDDSSVEKQRQIIVALQQQLDEARKTSQPPSDALGRLDDEEKQGVLTILKLLANASGNQIHKETLIQQTGAGQTKARYFLDKALETRLVSDDGISATLTTNGRAYAYRQNLQNSA